MRKRQHNPVLRYVVMFLIFAVVIVLYREIVWIIALLVFTILSYAAGQQDLINKARKHSKLESNARYGKQDDTHETYAWGPGLRQSRVRPDAMTRQDFPGGPEMELDAVSPYPPGMTADEENERVTGTLRAVSDETKRARLLRDKLGGAHKLFKGDDDD